MINNGYTNYPTDGLVGAWNGDGDWVDRSGNGNDGTPTNVVYENAEVGFMAEQGVFNGASANTIIPHNAIYNFTTNMSVSFWVNKDILEGNKGLVGKWSYQPNSTGTNQWAIYTVATGEIRVTLNTGASTNLDTTTQLSTGTWYLYTFTYDGSNMRCYLNGVEENSTAKTGSIVNTGTLQNISIGDYAYTTGDQHFDGKEGLVRLYNTTLTQSEINNLYYEGIRKFGNRAAYPQLLQDTVGYWDFKGDAIDVIGGNNGTVSGATLTTNHLGQSNSAYSFNGTTDYITLPSGASPSGGTARTIHFWAKTVAEAVGSKTFYSTGVESVRSVLTINYDVLSNNDIYIAFNSNDFYTGTGVITDGTWHHIVLTYAGGTLSTTTVKLYIDGVSQSLTHSNINPGVANTSTTTTNLGNDKNNTGREINGDMSSPIFIQRALSASEVLTLYNLTSKKYIYPWTRESTLALQNGLVMHIGDSAGNDYSGNGNNGTPTNVSKVRRNQSEGGDYNGSSSYISVPADTSINFIDTDPFSFSCWINTDVAATYQKPMYKQQNIANEFNYGLQIYTSKVYFTLSKQGVGSNSAISTQSLTANTWYHLVGTSDGTNIKLYINGVQDGSATKTTAVSTVRSTAALDIGRGYTGAEYMDGKILEPKIWNRALSQEEIQSEYYLNFLNFN